MSTANTKCMHRWSYSLCAGPNVFNLECMSSTSYSRVLTQAAAGSSLPFPSLQYREAKPERPLFSTFTAGEISGSSPLRRPPRRREGRGTQDLRFRHVDRREIGVRATGVSAATNKVSAAGIRHPGGWICFPDGDGEAASASLRWAFVLSDLLLPGWIISGSGRESGEMRLGDGQRRVPASSRGLLHWSGWRGVKVGAPAFFLDVFDGKRRSFALRSDGVPPRPMSPRDNGAAVYNGRLLRSTKEQVSDGISSELGAWLVRLFLLRRRCQRRRRRGLRLDTIWMCSRTCRAFFEILSFLGVFVQFSCVCSSGSFQIWPRLLYSPRFN
jgi:hypothetical protein